MRPCRRRLVLVRPNGARVASRCFVPGVRVSPCPCAMRVWLARLIFASVAAQIAGAPIIGDRFYGDAALTTNPMPDSHRCALLERGGLHALQLAEAADDAADSAVGGVAADDLAEAASPTTSAASKAAASAPHFNGVSAGSLVTRMLATIAAGAADGRAKRLSLPSCPFTRSDGRPAPSPRLLLHARDLTLPDRFNFAAAAVRAGAAAAAAATHGVDAVSFSDNRAADVPAGQQLAPFTSQPLEHRTQHVLWDSDSITVCSGVPMPSSRSAPSRAGTAHSPTGVRFSSRAPF